MNATKEIEVGDVMVVVMDSGCKPETGNVSRVTKKQFRVTLVGGKEAGPFSKNEHSCYPPIETESGRWTEKYHELAVKSRFNRKHTKAYRHSDTVVAYLEEKATEADKAREEKKERGQREREEQDARRAAELKEVKEAAGGEGGLTLRTRMKEILPDGSRLYTINAPVSPQYEERKGGFEVIVIRCKNVEEMDWAGDGLAKVKKVEMAYTYVNASTSSFGSCSTHSYGNDADAIWDALRYQYHSW